MSDSVCRSCGAKLPSGAKFCPDCGASITGSMPEADRPGSQTSATLKRDLAIVLGTLVVIAVGYFALRTPTGPPPPPDRKEFAEHPDVGSEDMTQAMSSLSNLPTSFDSLVMLGNQFMDNNNFPVAAECYRRALEINGNAPDVRVDYGACLHSMGLPQRAIEEFKKVIAEDSSHAIASFNLGIVYRSLNEPDSARFYWKQYLELEPNGKAASTARELLKEIGE